MCDQLKGVEIQVQKNKRHVKEVLEQVSKLQQRSNDAKRYSRHWNLRLYRMKETHQSRHHEAFRGARTRGNGENLFLVDTVHRLGAPCDNTNRPIIIQFTLRNFRNKIWKVSHENQIMKEKQLMLQEHLTHADRMERNWMWPLMEAARKQGKCAGYHCPDTYIEGNKVTQDKGLVKRGTMGQNSLNS